MALSSIDFTYLIQEIDDIKDVSPNFDYSDYTNNLNANDLDIDAIVEMRCNEFMGENVNHTFPLTELGYEKQNIETSMFGEEILKETYNFNDTIENNGGSVDTCATEISNTQNDPSININEETKLNQDKTLAFECNTEASKVELKRKACDVVAEIKNVLSEFLNFHKINDSVETPREYKVIKNNIGDEKIKGIATRIIENKNTTVEKEVIPTKKHKCDGLDNALGSLIGQKKRSSINQDIDLLLTDLQTVRQKVTIVSEEIRSLQSHNESFSLQYHECLKNKEKSKL
ncbi:hypothetical protein MSG28_016191 [Choristoneura fumiferana]|uniref:Uncharacterized protein n=1 Tax=Choristoneura fumiferana TaxID=7141 RepID=A0ACC0K687_CHOFU|nr:hypothetical protein MSG28_016191 [Choristoneura fumiferana]